MPGYKRMPQWHIEQLAPRVLAAIPWGRENARFAEEIEREAEAPYERHTSAPTRQVIRFLLGQGHSIYSSTNNGYWLTADHVEMLAYAKSLAKRRREIRSREADVVRIAIRLRNKKRTSP